MKDSEAKAGSATPIDPRRRRVCGALGGWGVAALGALQWPAHAAAPWKPDAGVEFVVPAGPGGALDQVGRAMKQYYDQSGAAPGKPFLVSNKPGANGKIAFDVLMQHPRDPHYLSINTHGYIASYLTGNLDILPHRDLQTIAVLQEEFLILAVRADSPFKDLQALLAALRADPASQRLAVATSIGNHIHIGTAKALKAGGVDVSKLVVAPFRSSMDSIVALVGGQLEMVAATTPNALAMMQAGRIRLLAVSSDTRLGGAFAGVPTWRESGVDTSFHSALGIVGPKGLAPEQIAFWENVCRQMVATTAWKRLVELNQSKSLFIPHAQATEYYEKEYQSMLSTVREIGLLAKGIS
ncbi:Tripartite tricarboxylate transporter family receptor [Variovorax sp. PBL-E5]|nr:Tripartite tricarboxylate transporter family receptor [Variovorax sp. PBL-E5]